MGLKGEYSKDIEIQKRREEKTKAQWTCYQLFRSIEGRRTRLSGLESELLG
jgi:hypothetical protein